MKTHRGHRPVWAWGQTGSRNQDAQTCGLAGLKPPHPQRPYPVPSLVGAASVLGGKPRAGVGRARGQRGAVVGPFPHAPNCAEGFELAVRSHPAGRSPGHSVSLPAVPALCQTPWGREGRAEDEPWAHEGPPADSAEEMGSSEVITFPQQ